MTLLGLTRKQLLHIVLLLVACSAGTKDFIGSRLSPHKDEYTIKEIIDLTTDEYGGEIFEKVSLKKII